MSEIETRLQKCFLTIFPQLEKEEIPSAGMTSVAEWDSLATVTLVAVLEEEFHFEFSSEELEYLTSYELILELTRSKLNENLQA